MLDPETGAIIFIVGGLAAVGTYGAFRFAENVGPNIDVKDLLPAPPWVGLPLPMAYYKTKVEGNH